MKNEMEMEMEMEISKPHYMCKRCSYKTEKKSSIINHINRVKICEPYLEDVDLKKNDIQKIILTKIYTKECIYCNKYFEYISSLKRHLIFLILHLQQLV